MNVVIEGSQVLITQCSEKEKALARGIACRSWDRKTLGWKFPCRPEIIKELAATLSIEIPREAQEICKEISFREAGVREEKIKGWENYQETIPMPIKNATPFNHQKLAFSLCCQLLGI